MGSEMCIRDRFNSTAGSLYVSMGGRDQEMTFGIGRIGYTDLYDTERTIAQAITTGTAVDGPNKGAKFNLAHLPSDAVVVKNYGKSTNAALDAANNDMEANKSYVITARNTTATQRQYGTGGDDAGEILAKGDIYRKDDSANTKLDATSGDMADFDVIVIGAAPMLKANFTEITFKEVNATSNAFQAGEEYEIMGFGTQTATVTVANYNEDAAAIGRAVTGINNTDVLTVGQKFTVDKDASIAELAHLNSLTGQMTFRKTTDTLTKDIEAIQGLVNTARVQAGSQYAAIESAVNYTTDLTAQYELGYNTVNDVNFSMETAHLAKNQILQQAATAMLAQANQGQQGLLQLIS